MGADGRASSNSSARNARGPEAQPHVPRELQPRMVDAAVGETPTYWTNFDVGRTIRSIRMLCFGTEAQKRQELRKLHLRWWYARRAPVERTLMVAGIPERVVAKIPCIINTCKRCRAWQLPGPEPTPAVELMVTPEDAVDGGLLFYLHYMVWHMLDRTDR